MAWVQIQKSQEATWDDYERVRARVGDEPPPGLVGHYAGEVDGRWESVSIWESREACDRFRDERLMPAVREVIGEEAVAAGPPPEEWFEVKATMRG
jgi:hypothetical protein